MKTRVRFFLRLAAALLLAAPGAVLADEAVKGLLLLQSEPAGCAITIDGESFGTTPRLVTSLDATAPHRVTLRKSGFCVATFDVSFEGRTPLVHREALVSDAGTVTVETEPAGATVSVNGVDRTGKTPLTLRDLPKGRVKIGVRLEGYADASRELEISAADRQDLSFALEGLPGTLAIASIPEGATIYLDGEARGKAPLTLRGLKPGSYELRAELEGRGALTRVVRLKSGKWAREEFELTRNTGRLEVRTDPVGATVTVDGRRIGTTTAASGSAAHSDRLPVENLLEGEHALVVRAEGYEAKTRRVKIEDKKTLKVDVRLKKAGHEPDVEIVTDEDALRGVYVEIKNGYYVIETNPGVQKSIPKDIVRKVRWLKSKPGKSK